MTVLMSHEPVVLELAVGTPPLVHTSSCRDSSATCQNVHYLIIYVMKQFLPRFKLGQQKHYMNNQTNTTGYPRGNWRKTF